MNDHIEGVMLQIDLITDPGQMPKQEALEFLEQCATELEGRIEALKDELRNSE